MTSDLSRSRVWRSLLIFDAYRLVQMPLMAVMILFASGNLLNHPLFGVRYIYVVGGAHAGMIGVGLLLAWLWKRRFNAQVSTQLLVDLLGINLLMFAAEGVKSGFGGVLMISVAGASLMTPRHLALFYAALASVSVLGMEMLQRWLFSSELDMSGIAHGGFLSLGFFVVAISANLIGRRISSNEDLVWQRGVELDNQIRIRRRVMERMQDGVLVVDAEGRIQQCNPMALAILGINPEREKGALSRIEPDLARRYKEWRDAAGSKRVELRRPEGRDISVRFVRTYSSDGAALVFLEDMTRLRERAQQLKLASLGRLTASIAHEIRNPLSAIRHASDLLAEELQSPVQERLLRIVHDNIQRLDGVIQDVLVLGRQRASGQDVVPLFGYLTEFVQEIRAQEQLDESVIRLQGPESAKLHFESGQLRQVLWNLVRNALRYASRKPGAVCLEIKLRSDSVELHILDDGPGIPADLREQIFEPFFSTAAKGTGLGLYIARELCEANGASLFLITGDSRGHFVLKGKGEPWQPQMNDAPEAL